MNIICGASQVNRHSLLPYSDIVCDFLTAYSSALRKDTEAKRYSDVMTFAFWARKSNIWKKKDDYIKRYSNQRRIGKGIIFHIAPSNVPVNCMFTYAFGLLAGNSNIVRVPSRDFPQVNCMLRILNKVLEEEVFSDIRKMTSFVRYDRTEMEYTEQYSSICDMRVIWGGDDTIKEIRRIELPCRSTEISFADRYSFGIVDVETILKMSDKELKALAEGFYNDTYLMDQNACSTPHLICFRVVAGQVSGEYVDDDAYHNILKAKERFWTNIADVASKYDFADIKVSDKYTFLCEKVMDGVREYGDNSENNDTEELKPFIFNGDFIKDIIRFDNILYVCQLSELPKDVAISCRGRYGMFFEYTFDSLEELSMLFNTKVQTCAVFGVEEDEIRDYVMEHGLCGIDRVVPFGKTLDIDTIWDGYDLINCMSRVIG